MAHSAKLLSFLFVLSLFVSQHALARSVFFSKVANVDNHNDVKEESTPQELTNKDNTVVTKLEQEPSFYTQTQSGYGLYGHDSTELHPSTTINNDEKYKYTTTSDEALTASERPYTTTTTNENNNIPYTHYNPKKNSLYYNGHNKNYETDQYGMSDTRLTQQRGYTTPTTTQYGMSDTRLTQQRGYTTPTTTQSGSGHSNSYFNVERQGMSDTRFMENGKYYYDPNSELENNNYNTNQYRDSRVVDSRNWYNNNNNKGYYGRNNNKGYYGSNNGNQNTYESNDVYQNEEFQENEDDKFVP